MDSISDRLIYRYLARISTLVVMLLLSGGPVSPFGNMAGYWVGLLLVLFLALLRPSVQRQSDGTDADDGTDSPSVAISRQAI